MLTKKIPLIKDWAKENKSLLITTVLIYQVAILAIGLVAFPYIDDTARQLTGATDFARSYSRWGSEIASWLVQGSRHLTDMGLTTHILTGLILALSSVIVVYCLNNKKLELLPLIVSTIIGLNPWFLQSVSFRFDSPYMALSILFSIIPFLWWEKKSSTFFIVSVISIFLMCNTYQSSSGIYIIMVLALSLKELLSNKDPMSTFKKIAFSALAYISAMLIYVLETKFNPELADRGGHVVIASIKDIPQTFLTNSKMYLHRILEQSTKVWLALFIILILLFITTSILNSKLNKVKSIVFILLYLILGAVLSYGVFLIFPEKLALVAPRYAYGFGVFTSITFILLLNKLPANFINITTKVFVCLFCYYILSFPFVYASTLQYQKEAFEKQSLILADDLKDLIKPNIKAVYANTLFKDSPILINSVRNYSILKDLVPTNSEIYWPNQLLFKTYTGMKININQFKPKTFQKNPSELKLSNYYYDIYEKNDDLYIIVK
ncbi:glucosyltransferase domain-containing protein [Candidatus Enterococcus ikei]|uniref:Glucosyltransferase domain-containing protein n=1 Tax=Candidatus Enterococcus ikei TaxID=2815326 RepID=A0ABS3GYS6_9ENTE|nr:glucosyltransferase domain-containing protein [Enterococcus sp. DIV0869a]MBO0440407.1 glucosyltransferase domain-containing protein [Enterococcus sp. DIV0869a]